MRYSFLLTALFLICAQSSSPKRGICHVPSVKYPNDDRIWTSGPSSPAWYYNYQFLPSLAFKENQAVQHVPMLWGVSEVDYEIPFFDSIKRQLEGGANISYVLGFNEPDGAYATGGSSISVELAARRWKAEIEPLKALGIKVGAPGVTGSESGRQWLKDWIDECDCGYNPDFIPVHWYGNFEGMMSHVGQVTAEWPNLPVWVTEYGYPNQALDTTQEFYNQSSRSFDNWSNITHYSYFGAFRSDVSNVGPNAAMLDQDGRLTDIGSWYLGGVATNNVPQTSAAALGIVQIRGFLIIPSFSMAWSQLQISGKVSSVHGWMCCACAIAILSRLY
ncbi:glycosyl hydrolase catalytic core-domain-containing protein [Pyrenochaeta sp. MPI-SDFR-AT-0127]|nr:glycosyl hydrolase catalytic core-domain-containing protein [Pyrenochaeta sp. MPI-SDFR-AT-0127]